LGSAPSLRIQVCNKAPVNPQGDFVLYWMIANRRATWNFSLQEAVEWAKKLKKPLLVLEALRSDYPWASDRLHQFIISGMADNEREFERSGVLYYPYVEQTRHEGRGLLLALSTRACLVVTDHFPAFFLPPMVSKAAKIIPVRLIQVDSNGLLPLRAADHVFPTAYTFRRFLQKDLPRHLRDFPQANPLAKVKLPTFKTMPAQIIKRWPRASAKLLAGDPASLKSLPLDHSVKPAEIQGGGIKAQAVLKKFLKEKLASYSELRNHPDEDATSGLSPYLHFGHISVHQIFSELMEHEGWSFKDLSAKAAGSRSGWWGVSHYAEAFLDQLIVWRELGYNMCALREDYAQYAGLPNWALKTLAQHSRDRRKYIYDLPQLEAGMTHDLLWNAAQRQLVREGQMHNYLRMLWGKKILEWSESPRAALEVMIELNNKYALDGRDPNSYSGIFWVLGRYDRPWGPERPIFGKIRYLSSENTARKVRVREYISRYAP